MMQVVTILCLCAHSFYEERKQPTYYLAFIQVVLINETCTENLQQAFNSNILNSTYSSSID